MTTVITYGTYDLLHYGHIRLLERAKALGDTLIVGVTSDDFDKTRGKLNVQQSLAERIESVRQTGLADKIIVEEYEGQKIDDIQRYGVDIFTVGSDWVGKFDYLNDYCRVVYLDRTEGISSTQLRSADRKLRLGLIGTADILKKYVEQSAAVNGIEITGIFSKTGAEEVFAGTNVLILDNMDAVIGQSDAVYIVSPAAEHAAAVRKALDAGKHVLCESPIALTQAECRSLFALAEEKHLVLMDAIKTAYSQAYARMLLLAKVGKIGEVVSVDAACTSLKNKKAFWRSKGSMGEWGPTTLLPVFDLLGTQVKSSRFVTLFSKTAQGEDLFTKIELTYPQAVATLKVGEGVKAEGELIIAGTKGYIYVPAPWWKTEYFEIRYENPADNRRYFYQLDGEGIRYQLIVFLKAIRGGRCLSYISPEVSEAISGTLEKFIRRQDFVEISFGK